MITADGDSSHRIKSRLLLGRKVMTNLDRILKRGDVTFPTKVCIVKAMVFSNSNVWNWELDCKEGWSPKDWCFWTVVLEEALESPLDCKEIKPIHFEGNQPRVLTERTDLDNTLAISWEEKTPRKRPWCWESVKAGGEGSQQRMRWLDSVTEATNMNLTKL